MFVLLFDTLGELHGVGICLCPILVFTFVPFGFDDLALSNPRNSFGVPMISTVLFLVWLFPV